MRHQRQSIALAHNLQLKIIMDLTEACPTRDKIHMVWSAVRRLQGGRSPFPFQIRRRRLVPVCALSLFLAKV
jgi:hypothetical protein